MFIPYRGEFLIYKDDTKRLSDLWFNYVFLILSKY